MTTRLSSKQRNRIRLKYYKDGKVPECGVCHTGIHPSEFSLDHIKPISKGGRNNRSNLQPTHIRCNIQKGDAYEGPPRAARPRPLSYLFTLE